MKECPKSLNAGYHSTDWQNGVGDCCWCGEKLVSKLSDSEIAVRLASCRVEEAMTQRELAILAMVKEKTGMEIGCVVEENWQSNKIEYLVRSIEVPEYVLDEDDWEPIKFFGAHMTPRRGWAVGTQELIGDLRLVRTADEEKKGE